MRLKGNEHHAFRKGFKTGLAELGVDLAVRDLLLGHHRGIDAHYLDLTGQARDAADRVPPLADETLASAVLAFRRDER